MRYCRHGEEGNGICESRQSKLLPTSALENWSHCRIGGSLEHERSYRAWGLRASHGAIQVSERRDSWPMAIIDVALPRLQPITAPLVGGGISYRIVAFCCQSVNPLHWIGIVRLSQKATTPIGLGCSALHCAVLALICKRNWRL